jgi:dienelactone hydrolase
VATIAGPTAQEVTIRAGTAALGGTLDIPPGARAAVVFAHGSGSSRHSPRNRYVAQVLRRAGMATLLTDLLTPDEERREARTRHLRFDIALLAERLSEVTDYLVQAPDTRDLVLGYFGASTGAAAALVAAAGHPELIRAVVSRGGRPDLAAAALPGVRAPTLLIVGGADYGVIEMNEQALGRLTVEKSLIIVPGATHLFEEPGALEQVAHLATDWFARCLLGA